MKYEKLITDAVDQLQPYQPRSLEPNEVKLSKILQSKRWHRFTVNEARSGVCISRFVSKTNQLQPLVNARWYQVTGDDFEARLAVDEHLLNYMCKSFNFEAPTARLSSDVKDAVTIAALDSYLGSAFNVQISNITPSSAPNTRSDELFALAGEFHLGEQSFAQQIVVNKAFGSQLINLLSHLEVEEKPLNQDILAVPLLTQFIVDELTIAGSEIRSLIKGDVIVLDNTIFRQQAQDSSSAAQLNVLVRVQHKLQQKGYIVDEQLTLDGYLETFKQDVAAKKQAQAPEFTESLPKESAQAQENATDGSQDDSQADTEKFLNEHFSAPAQTKTSQQTARSAVSQHNQRANNLLSKKTHESLLNDLPVEVTFELGRQNFTLEELRSLNAGQCLPVQEMTPKNIHILVNGMNYASGELVQLGEEVGVRITNVLHDSQQ